MIKKLLLCFTITILIITNLQITYANSQKCSGFLGRDCISEKLVGSEKKLDITIDSYVGYLLFFLYFIAVMYGIYGGALILTAASDDEKVKKGRTIIIQGVIGIVVIFLAGPIMKFFIGGGNEKGTISEKGLLNSQKK